MTKVRSNNNVDVSDLYFSFPAKTLTASGSTSGSQIIFADTTSTALTTTISTSDLGNGKIILIKDSGGNATTNNITIATEGSALIDGAATATISTNDSQIRLVSNGTDWFSW